MRKPIIMLAAIALIFSLPFSALAKENSLIVFGSYMPTYLGIEYERRMGSWGLGVEAGLLPIGELGGVVRVNLIGRYYVDILSSVSPYISLSPGILMSWQDGAQASDTLSELSASFFGYATAGLEYRISILRAAVEIGGGFDASPQAAQPHGYFLFKGGIGIVF